MTCLSCGDRLTWLLCGWSKLPWFLFAGRKSPGSGVRIEIDLLLVWVVEIDLFCAVCLFLPESIFSCFSSFFTCFFVYIFLSVRVSL